MQTGISTASLFFRKTTEDALSFLAENNVFCTEIFLESYCEYNEQFGKILKEKQNGIKVHSVHTLTTQFEPQLYSINERAKSDSFKLLDMAMSAGEQVGAEYYTFHGGARFKKTPIKLDFDRIGKITQEIIDSIKKHNIKLAYENVHWGYYNYIGFFEQIKKRTEGLKATLDIKQARQSGIHYSEFIDEMGPDIVTVHLSDIDEQGKMCLPGKGITDFADIFKRLEGVGFDGALLIEVYQSDYKEYSELFECLDFIKNLSAKIFKKQ